jgi:hypothetical protein
LRQSADVNAIRKALCRDSQGRSLGPVAAALDLITAGETHEGEQAQ